MISIPTWVLVVMSGTLGYVVTRRLIPPEEDRGEWFPFPDLHNLALHVVSFLAWLLLAGLLVIVYALLTGQT